MSRFENIPRLKPIREKNVVIVYSIFNRCAEISEQKFWQDMFINMSRNKFPKNVKFSDDTLTIKKRNKIVSCTISDDPIDTEQRVRQFLQQEGIMSAEDKRARDDVFSLYSVPTRGSVYTTWSKIRGNSVTYEIHNYAMKVKTAMGLTEEQHQNLLEIISLGILANIFNSNTIVLKDGSISHIEGLGYNPETKRFFVADPLSAPKSRSGGSTKRVKLDYFIELWKTGTSKKKRDEVLDYIDDAFTADIASEISTTAAFTTE